MQSSNDEAIVPASEILELEPVEPSERPWPRRHRLPIWARLLLLVLAGIWVTVFTIGALLNPYRPPAFTVLGASAVGLAMSPHGDGALVAVAAIANDHSDPATGGQRTARRMETHMQMGLPQCTFKEVTGYPCPSCGMTTSFSLLMHGDVWNSLQANFAGTILATLGLIFVPWSVLSAWRGRFLFIHSLELTLFRISIVFIILLFGRWGIALAMTYWAKSGG